MCADPAGLPSMRLLFKLKGLNRGHFCPQITQMDADKSGNRIETEEVQTFFAREAHAPRTESHFASLFICGHLRHLRTISSVPSFASRLTSILHPRTARRSILATSS